MDTAWRQRLEDTATQLKSVSPTFCAAKWLQVTLHLQTGMTHSCHHPKPHKIPLDGLATNADLLHNTPFKEAQRELMRKGQRPPECDFCWKAEDASPGTFSDRVIKSADDWSLADFPRLAAQDGPKPTYLEVSFSNTCNMRCMYCAPDISSAIWGEYEKHGPYPVGGSYPLRWFEENARRPIKLGDHNPFVDAFNQWFPEVRPGLKVFRITGGEPLLNPQTFRTLEELGRTHSPELDLSVNSNLMVPLPLIQKLSLSLEKLAAEGRVKHARLYTSVDAHGKHAEYIRHGLDYKELLRNAHLFLKHTPHVDLTFIATHNVFSLFSFTKLLADILEMKRAHIREIRPEPRVMVDITYLRNPSYLSSLVAPAQLRARARHSWEFMEQNAESQRMPWGFNLYERNKMRRLWEMLEQGPQGEDARQLHANIKELKKFAEEYRSRKQLDLGLHLTDVRDFLDSIEA